MGEVPAADRRRAQHVLDQLVEPERPAMHGGNPITHLPGRKGVEVFFEELG
jgi:hypothetical protein